MTLGEVSENSADWKHAAIVNAREANNVVFSYRSQKKCNQEPWWCITNFSGSWLFQQNFYCSCTSTSKVGENFSYLKDLDMQMMKVLEQITCVACSVSLHYRKKQWQILKQGQKTKNLISQLQQRAPNSLITSRFCFLLAQHKKADIYQAEGVLVSCVSGSCSNTPCWIFLIWLHILGIVLLSCISAFKLYKRDSDSN